MSDAVIRPFRVGEIQAVASWAYEAPYDWYDGDPAHAEDLLSVDERGCGHYAIVAGADEEVSRLQRRPSHLLRHV